MSAANEVQLAKAIVGTAEYKKYKAKAKHDPRQVVVAIHRDVQRSRRGRLTAFVGYGFDDWLGVLMPLRTKPKETKAA